MDSKFKGGYSRMTGCTVESHPEYDRGFRNGQKSKQAEIDALKAELAKYQKEGYKLVPVEPTKDMLDAQDYIRDVSAIEIYKAMIGAAE